MENKREINVHQAESFRQADGSVFIEVNVVRTIDVEIDKYNILSLLQVVLTAIRLHGDKELARKICKASLGG